MRTLRRAARAAVAVFAVACVGSGASAAAPAASDAYHIVIPKRAVGAGEHVALRVEPPVPAGARINWWLPGRNEGLLAAVYRAPLVIPPGTPPVSVGVSITIPSERRTVQATTEIDLITGAVADAGDCLGPGQQFSTQVAGFLPAPTTQYVLDPLVIRGGPDYPRSALAREIAQTIVMRTLLCRTGRVIDTYHVPAIDDSRQPIPFDPKLAEAAEAAVRQHIFTSPILPPGIAVWADVPVKFQP